jgi:hypothetical protein
LWFAGRHPVNDFRRIPSLAGNQEIVSLRSRKQHELRKVAKEKTVALRRLSLLCVVAALALFGLGERASGQTTFTGGSVNLSSGTLQSSTLTVGTVGAVSSVSVELDGVTASGTCNSCPGGAVLSLQTTYFILQAPSGQKIVLLGATGSGSENLSNLKITITDSASGPTSGTQAPLGGVDWTTLSGYSSGSVSVRPTLNGTFTVERRASRTQITRRSRTPH